MKKKKNIMLSLDDNLHSWAIVFFKQQGSTLSRTVNDTLATLSSSVALKERKEFEQKVQKEILIRLSGSI